MDSSHWIKKSSVLRVIQLSYYSVHIPIEPRTYDYYRLIILTSYLLLIRDFATSASALTKYSALVMLLMWFQICNYILYSCLYILKGGVKNKFRPRLGYLHNNIYFTLLGHYLYEIFARLILMYGSEMVWLR